MTNILDYGFAINPGNNICSEIGNCNVDGSNIAGQRCCLIYKVNVTGVGDYKMLATVKHPSGDIVDYRWSQYLGDNGVGEYWKAVTLDFGYARGAYSITQLGFV